MLESKTTLHWDHQRFGMNSILGQVLEVSRSAVKVDSGIVDNQSS